MISCANRVMTLHVVDLGGPRNSGYLMITRYAIWSQQGPQIVDMRSHIGIGKARREWITSEHN